jgi:glycosyltransferase involved in cell wall biosynthesis
MVLRGRNEKKIFVASLHFSTLELPGLETVCIGKIGVLDILRIGGRVEYVFCANPSSIDILKLAILKVLFLFRIKTIVFDLILKRPIGLRERLISLLKGLAIGFVDLIICLQKDVSGYERFYRIPRRKFEYVPFKANNLDVANFIRGEDGDYVVSCGASYRDYKTLIEAVSELQYPTRIIMSEGAEYAHNARWVDTLPSNVQRLNAVHSREEYSRLIAGSRVVVVPILSAAIQPAGISVCLEAMALGKPVIVSRGVSSNGVLDGGLALICEPENVSDLKEKLALMWEDEQLRKEYARRGKDYAHSLGGNAQLAKNIENAIQTHFGINREILGDFGER